MNAKELIKENNHKRKLLTENNEQYYEKMLIYIRTQLFLSEEQSEELLMELLEHLLEAQHHGKTAEEVFGDNPKAYARELVQQLPKETKSSLFIFIGFIFVQFIGWMALGHGGISVILGFFSDLGTTTIHLGSGAVQIIVDVIASILVIAFVLKLLRDSMFKKVSKWIEFLIIWMLLLFLFSIYIFSDKLIPAFGATFEVHGILFFIFGLIIIAGSKRFDTKFRLTK